MLLATYAFGDVLDSQEDVDSVQLAVVLALPADELTWWTEPQSCAGLPSLLEIDKAPVIWHWRPHVWPVANHVIRRPLRIWSVDVGPDTAALDALESGAAESLRLPAPPADEEHEQLVTELDASLRHLRRVEESYWERAWRSDNRGLGYYPEHHLWNAVHGYLELLAAVRDREPKPPQA